MRIIITTLTAAISFTVFACSDSSPSSPSTENSSSSEVSSSSSGGAGVEGTACEYPGEKIGIEGPFICAEAPNYPGHRAECEADGGTWVRACQSGEKATCIDEEDDEDVLYKLYADFTCEDLDMKNADGSGDIVSKGGACYPYMSNTEFSMCVEFPELSASLIKIACAELGTPFANECPINSDLICYDPDDDEDDIIYHFYGDAIYYHVCEDFDMEEYVTTH